MFFKIKSNNLHLHETCLILFVIALSVCSYTSSAPAADSDAASGIDWKAIAGRKPHLKVLILVINQRPMSLDDLALLAKKGFVPADRDPGLVLGLQKAVFAGRLGSWIKAHPLPSHLSGSVLEHFAMSGIYRVGFKVVDKGYNGPLELQITAPREGFGKILVYSDQEVRPVPSQTMMTVDSTGNRWLSASFERVAYGDSIRFYFGFKYHVDLAKLLEHDLTLSGKQIGTEVPVDVQLFLRPGHKIDSGIPAAQKWAFLGGTGPPDALMEYRRLVKFIKRNVSYDERKRSNYLGGRMVYTDLDAMYQDPEETLQRRLGACPDTSVLECAFLRARGIPCLTAGRFGHFFTLLYVPGRGWRSTSVTPTGIPLIRSPGPDLVPYQSWTPKISLKTTCWEARVRIDMWDKDELCR